MKVKDGKIIEASEDELFSVYLRKGCDDLMDFYHYMRLCEDAGTKIVED